MSTVKSKNLQVGTDATASNNFTIYQPSTPDGTLRIGVGNADSPTEVGRFTSAGYKPATAPAFSAYLSSNQSASSGVWTKMQINTENFDTNSNYDNSTNYRFTPTVAGYYQVNANVNAEGSTSRTRVIGSIYKNGVEYKRGGDQNYSNAMASPVSDVIYFNGTTDYIEVYGLVIASIGVFNGGQHFNYFSAILIQQA